MFDFMNCAFYRIKRPVTGKQKQLSTKANVVFR